MNGYSKTKLLDTGGKRVILAIGDGMSLTTVTTARILQGQQKGKTGEEEQLSWEKFPFTGLSKTYNVDYQVPDSAGTATAFLCGVKTDAGIIGLDENSVRGDCAASKGTEVGSILKLAKQAGLSVGIVVTARITHATPSSSYAHCPERNWEGSVPSLAEQQGCIDIAQQFINFQKEHGGISVALGGGRRNFIPNTQNDVEYPNTKGRRVDGKDLIQEWKNLQLQNSAYVWNLSDFNAIDPKKTDHLFGLFEPSHMQYESARNKGPSGEPSISEMTRKAIQILERNPKGYFLLIESGRIDHGHHEGSAYKALTEAVALAQAVETADKLTNENETLIIVTSDHGHTMSMSGYPKRGNPIFGLTGALGNYGKPSLTLNYANGPGAWKDGDPRPNLTGVDTAHPKFLQQAITKLNSETHDGTDVAIYARGPFSHLYVGVVEQNYIFHPMAKALCLDPSKAGQQTCSNSAHGVNVSILALLTTLMAIVLQFI
ncbi:uncharacterized protein TRIADDRAFT_22012 [Trichoplax adhaerens]|uniref:Alkaline phosphatase n=1 Tax=Trichoplax adhaerens TaxID=10228 RepID=B3RR73_TRIAD|nr:hypothetical protein TRIADDRAFT_22012 [Trichoplax adhaerens]EDV26293.1 hypothetical protein TRIADDRAFT_22012 [Trichoplax adhaerens]|eukprot:XP_002110289.1 hypothetical protein TRIADDRAFT_22012 [Trichoplax adhaerens]